MPVGVFRALWGGCPFNEEADGRFVHAVSFRFPQRVGVFVVLCGVKAAGACGVSG